MKAAPSSKKTKAPGGEPFLPELRTLPSLRAASQDCRGCDLYRHATQAVFGEGPLTATLFVIGEQPGNDEDRQGHPFVGPAGRILDKALAEAQIDRSEVYVTNTVKHFKFEERGKRRIHQKPNAAEVRACSPWLEAEIRLIRPKVILCLGATAAQSLLGRSFRLTQHRGESMPHAWAPSVVATTHPSAILRAPDEEQRHEEYRKLVADLMKVRSLLDQPTLKQSA